MPVKNSSRSCLSSLCKIWRVNSHPHNNHAGDKLFTVLQRQESCDLESHFAPTLQLCEQDACRRAFLRSRLCTKSLHVSGLQCSPWSFYPTTGQAIITYNTNSGLARESKSPPPAGSLLSSVSFPYLTGSAPHYREPDLPLRWKLSTPVIYSIIYPTYSPPFTVTPRISVTFQTHWNL